MEPKVRTANGMLLSGLALFNSDMKTLKRGKVYQFITRWIIDHSKYEQAFGINVRPHPEAVRRTVAWYREHRPT